MPGALRFHGIRKSFGAVRALRGVTFSVRGGEAHAVVGENGAGKSTLMKILAGILRPDEGRIEWDGRPLDCSTPRDALDAGIGMVYQDLLLFPNLTVTENIFAGRELTGRGGWLRARAMRERTVGLLEQLHVRIPPEAEVASLGAAQQQLLQIARALAFECRLLILDEPTTSLTDSETVHLFEVLDRLRGSGVTFIYVSHKLAEVFRLCDAITVLRDGEHAGTCSISDTSPRDVVRAMVGRDLDPAAARVRPPADATAPPLLEVAGLTRRPWFDDISLAVAPGEIVGLFGLVGSGRSELVETIFGLHPPDRGTIRLAGRPVRFHSAVDAVRSGIALVPEERHAQALFFNLVVREHLLLSAEQARGAWVIDRKAEEQTSRRLLEEWRIKAASVDATPDSLSGGNQQKLVLARWLATGPRLLLLDEPTKGVDVGAKYEIHAMIRRQADAGMGCLLVSSELPEMLALADRVLVLREGRLQGHVAGPDATEEAVIRLATATPDHEGTKA